LKDKRNAYRLPFGAFRSAFVIVALELLGCTAIVGIEDGVLALCDDGTRMTETGCNGGSGGGSGAGGGGPGGGGGDACPSCPGGCEAPWQYEDPKTGACYLQESTSRDWSSARKRCLDLGGDLAAIGSAEELAFVAPFTTDDTWIGGTDAANEGFFEWSNGEPWTYAAWKDGAPPDDPSEKQDCVLLTILPGATLPVFTARLCSDKRGYLCESTPP